MRRGARRLVVALAALACAGRAAAAQACTAGPATLRTCDVDLELALPVPDVLVLDVQGRALELEPLTLADYQRGYREVAGPLVRVWANRAYVVRLSAGPRFRYRGGIDDPGKPAADVRWGTTTGQFPHTLREEGETVLAGGPGPAGGAPPPARRLAFRIAWDPVHDPPGRFALDLRLTLAAP